MPPQKTIKVDNNKYVKYHLFQLLRPEYVRTYPIPLNPDAFSGFLRLSSSSPIHDNREVCLSRNLLNQLQ